ncbi:ATP-dependent zinc protease family protein [Stutzerimonas tarimensis]|uniref:ATP-dependent zinc protease n=1 Tax=Stutzerimonas tarimensis TaxID=1507735 RepID=A0ABV7T3S2_9GAMM
MLFSCLLFIPSLGLASGKTIFGLSEHVGLPDLGLQLPAKLDTGAQTASLSAWDIVHFRRDGERWVRFTLGLEDTDPVIVERPLARTSRIKRRAGDVAEDDKTYTSRPVIELDMCLGESLQRIEVNLTDRRRFEFPLLIGSSALTQFGALVDPSQNFAFHEPGCAVADTDE